MASHVIEGTWEEIKRHEAELVGHYLRVTINPSKVITRKPRAPAKKSLTPDQPKPLSG